MHKYALGLIMIDLAACGKRYRVAWATHKSSCKLASMYLSLKRVMRINLSYHSLLTTSV